MARPDYCPCKDEQPDPCPACGATVSGDDPVRGVCQARHNGPPPKPFLELVLVDKRTGEVVAKTTAEGAQCPVPSAHSVMQGTHNGYVKRPHNAKCSTCYITHWR